MSKELVYEAIDSRSVISFFYTGSRRIVEPHVLGFDHGGDLTLYAWQVSGSHGQSWRSFHFDKIHGVALTGAQFSNVRPGFNPHDWALLQIVCCASKPGAVCWPDPRGPSVERGRCAACERLHAAASMSLPAPSADRAGLGQPQHA